MKYKLSELAEVKYGKDHKKLVDGTIPVFGSGGLMRMVNQFIYDGESVLIPRKGTLDNIQFVSGKFWTVDTLFYTIINKEYVLPRYLFYLLRSIKFSEMNVGSAVPSMTTAVLNDLEFDIPKIEVQKRIITIIKSLEDKISKNNQTNDNLLNVA